MEKETTNNNTTDIQTGVASIAPVEKPKPKEVSFYSGTAGYVRFYNGMSVRIRPTGPVQREGSPEMLKNLTDDDWELYATLALKYADQARWAIKRFSEDGKLASGVIKFSDPLGNIETV